MHFRHVLRATRIERISVEKLDGMWAEGWMVCEDGVLFFMFVGGLEFIGMILQFVHGSKPIALVHDTGQDPRTKKEIRGRRPTQ